MKTPLARNSVLKYLWITSLFVLSAYAIFSYVFTDPNLVITSWEPYWQFQTWLWKTILPQPDLVASIYGMLVFLLFGLWFLALQYVKDFPLRKAVLALAVLIIPLLFSYNALSHDVFNYMFNAKMVVEYQLDPHVETAQRFVGYEPWTRFMHNVHTPAPYGYGWTALSLPVYVLGLNTFLGTWILFRLFAVLGLYLVFRSVNFLSKALRNRELSVYEFLLVFCNPLVLIEVIGNMHNDVWMMAPAIFSFGLLVSTNKFKNGKKILLVLLSIIFLLASILIKLATAVLIPLWLVLLSLQIGGKLIARRLQKRIPLPINWLEAGANQVVLRVERLFPSIALILLFIPLFTERSQQFHPWYLLWVLVWVPFVKHNLLKNTVLVFSMSSLLRYLPWLYQAEYSPEVLQQQLLITWGIPLLYIVLHVLRNRSKSWSSL